MSFSAAESPCGGAGSPDCSAVGSFHGLPWVLGSHFPPGFKFSNIVESTMVPTGPSLGPDASFFKYWVCLCLRFFKVIPS